MNPELHFVSYNICMGKNAQKVVGNLEQFAYRGARLFCLQEVRRSYKDVSVIDLLLKRLGPLWQAESFLSSKSKSFDYGLCLVWHSETLEPIKFEHLSLPRLHILGLSEMAYEIFTRRGFRSIQRGVLVGHFIYQGQPLRISNLHLDWQGGLKHRLKQIKFLREHLQEQGKLAREIVCGDLNTIFFGRTARLD